MARPLGGWSPFDSTCWGALPSFVPTRGSRRTWATRSTITLAPRSPRPRRCWMHPSRPTSRGCDTCRQAPVSATSWTSSSTGRRPTPAFVRRTDCSNLRAIPTPAWCCTRRSSEIHPLKRSSSRPAGCPRMMGRQTPVASDLFWALQARLRSAGSSRLGGGPPPPDPGWLHREALSASGGVMVESDAGRLARRLDTAGAPSSLVECPPLDRTSLQLVGARYEGEVVVLLYRGDLPGDDAGNGLSTGVIADLAHGSWRDEGGVWTLAARVDSAPLAATARLVMAERENLPAAIDGEGGLGLPQPLPSALPFPRPKEP